jgi:hypothetical protein
MSFGIQKRWYRGNSLPSFIGREFLYFRHKKTEVKMMIGMQDIWVSAAWMLSIGSAIGCVVYGALHWNYEEEEE